MEEAIKSYSMIATLMINILTLLAIVATLVVYECECVLYPCLLCALGKGFSETMQCCHIVCARHIA